MFKHQLVHQPSKTVRRLVAATLCVLSSATIGVASLPQEGVQAVAGSPRVPSNGSVVFLEDFEYKGDPNANPPKSVVDYVGSPAITGAPAGGMTYTSSPYWASEVMCNSMVMTQLSKPDVVPGQGIPASLCGGSWEAWRDLRNLSAKLSKKFGKPGDAYTVASYTAGDGVAPSDYVQLQSKAVSVPAGGAFLTTAIDTGAYNCQAAAPTYLMYLTDATGAKKPVQTGPINPCSDPKAIVDTSIDGLQAYLTRSVGNSPVLISTPSVSFTIENQNVNGFGNDATFDNIQILDVSPQLDKTFTTPIPLGSTSTATFTITNALSPAGDGTFTKLDAKAGWSFTDALPLGLTIVGTPVNGSGAEACANFSSAGTNSATVAVKGDLLAGQAYCTVTVQVKATAPGDYTNLASSVSSTGLKKPADAKVTFFGNPAITLKKSAAVLDSNANGMTDAGDQLDYSFLVTNSGNVPLSNVAVSDAKIGPVTCNPTTVPVGGSVACKANSLYTLTLADVAAGKVDNTASVTGTDGFTGNQVTASDTLTTPVNAAPRLTLTKTAGTPVDVNKSTLTDAGDTIPYLFKVTNAGNVPLSTIRVDDPTLGGPVTCVPLALNPGQSADCTGSHTITPGDQAATQYVNKATAHGVTPAGVDTASNEATTTTPVQKPAPALLMKKSAAAPVDTNGSGITDAGDTIQFSFTVTNTGNVPIKTVTVTDPLVGAVTCPPAELVVKAIITCTANAPYVITKADQTAGTVNNTASAAGVAPDGSKVTSNNDSTSTPVLLPAPKLVFEKFASTPADVNGSGITDAGDTISYTFKVTNTGNVPVTGVTVTDDKAGAVTCTPTALKVNEVANCIAVKPYVITKTDEGNTSVKNTASAAAIDPNKGPVTSNTASTNTPVQTPAPALRFTKTAAAPVDVNKSLIPDAGDTVQYTFTVTNTGNVLLNNVRIDDPLAGSATCDKTILAPKEMANCVADKPYVIKASDVAAHAANNTATAYAKTPAGAEIPSNTASTVTPLVTPAPSLMLKKTAAPSVDVNKSTLSDAGDTIQYTFAVTNTGNVPVTELTITDPLVGKVTCASTSLAVTATTQCKADAVYVITQNDEKAGRVDNTATASAKAPDGSAVASNTDHATSPVATPAPSLTLDKSALAPVDVNKSGLPDAGDTVQYEFAVTNNGNVPLTGIKINDPLIGTATCQATSLAVGKATKCVADKPYIITKENQSAGSVVNTAVATGTDPQGGPVSSKPDTTTTIVKTPLPALSFTKSAAPSVDVNKSGTRDAGDTIQYTFTVTNNGNVPMTGITINDSKIGAATCDVTDLAVGKTAKCAATKPYTITKEDQAAGLVLNIASASGQAPDGNKYTSNTAETTTPLAQPKASLSLEKFASAPFDSNRSGLPDAGDTIRFSFTVTNNGNVPVTKMKVNDPMVTGITCATDSLAVGASTQCVSGDYTITDKDQTAGAVKNVANATGNDPTGAAVTSNNANTATPVQKPSPLLSLTKEALDSNGVARTTSHSAGDSVTFRFTVVNHGNVTINNVKIIDGMIGSITCKATTLAVGASTVCTADKPYIITAADATVGKVQNTATAAGTYGNGQSTTSPPASVTLYVIAPGKVPETGGNSAVFGLAGLVLVLLGGLGLIIVRRRPRRGTSN